MNQVMAMWTGQELRVIPDEEGRKAEAQYDGQRGEAELHFASLKRVLAKEDSAFKDIRAPAKVKAVSRTAS